MPRFAPRATFGRGLGRSTQQRATRARWLFRLVWSETRQSSETLAFVLILGGVAPFGAMLGAVGNAGLTAALAG